MPKPSAGGVLTVGCGASGAQSFLNAPPLTEYSLIVVDSSPGLFEIDEHLHTPSSPAGEKWIKTTTKAMRMRSLEVASFLFGGGVLICSLKEPVEFQMKGQSGFNSYDWLARLSPFKQGNWSVPQSRVGRPRLLPDGENSCFASYLKVRLRTTDCLLNRHQLTSGFVPLVSIGSEWCSAVSITSQEGGGTIVFLQGPFDESAVAQLQQCGEEHIARYREAQQLLMPQRVSPHHFTTAEFSTAAAKTPLHDEELDHVFPVAKETSAFTHNEVYAPQADGIPPDEIKRPVEDAAFILDILEPHAGSIQEKLKAERSKIGSQETPDEGDRTALVFLPDDVATISSVEPSGVADQKAIDQKAIYEESMVVKEKELAEALSLKERAENQLARLWRATQVLASTEESKLYHGCLSIFQDLGWQTVSTANQPLEALLAGSDPRQILVRIVMESEIGLRMEVCKLLEGLNSAWISAEHEPKGVLVVRKLNLALDEEPEINALLDPFVSRSDLCIATAPQLFRLWQLGEQLGVDKGALQHRLLSRRGLLT